MNTSSASLSASESIGFFGAYGGQFVPDDLKARLDEVTEAFDRYSDNSFFKDELDYYFKHYTGRPNPIFFCANLSERLGGAKIYLKREDLNHLGAHKINNTLGQCLLAKRMGKKRIVAETGAGQHGVATAATAALLGLECTVYMGAEDMKRQRLHTRMLLVIDENHVFEKIAEYHRLDHEISGNHRRNGQQNHSQADDPG